MKFLNRLRLPLFVNYPNSPTEGEVWYDTAADQLKFQSSGSNPVSLSSEGRFTDFVSGRWYMTTSGGSTTSTPIANRVYGIPFSLSKLGTLNGIATEVVTAFTTAGTVRAGMYNGDSNSPSTLIADYGTVAATAGIKTWTISQSLAPGNYFIAIVYQGGSSGSPTFRTAVGLAEGVGDLAATPASTFFNGAQNTYYSSSTQAGALGSLYGAVGGSTGGPRVAIKFA